MNFPQKSFLTLLFACLSGLSSLSAAEPSGQWIGPNVDGKAWKHTPTQLSFPNFLGDYRFTGHFEYDNGGTLVRYENLEEQARLDIFLFKNSVPILTLNDKRLRLLSEMDIIKSDMETMAKEGRYKNLNFSEIGGGELDLWQKQSIPIATRIITATRQGISKEGSEEAVVRQWVGATLMDDYLITIRHMRPIHTGDAGEEAMKRMVGMVFQILKDPSLRTHIETLLKEYLADPFSDHGEQVSAAVLAYLKQTPYFPINIPEDPVADWLNHCKSIAPGTEDELLRAFMLGGAKAAFADGDAVACLKEGSLQFAKIYRVLVKDHPQISLPEMESFVTAAEKGEGALWMQKYSLRK